MRRLKSAATVALIAIVVTGCVTTTQQTITTLSAADRSPKIVLMPVDVTLSEITTGGALEVKADWTKAAEANVSRAIADQLARQNARTVDFETPLDPKQKETDEQLVKLHRIVGATIMSPIKLPTKKDKFEWTLGPDVRTIGKSFNADYALFVRMQDSYSSAGHIIASVIAAALFGAPIQGGRQIGYASLVDLKSGDIVWFNALVRGEGDLRKPEPAANSVKLLLANFPK